MEKIFVKLNDPGTTFNAMDQAITVVGKRPVELENTPLVSQAVRVGILVKLDKAEYTEALKAFNEELERGKRIEAKAIELGNPNNLDAARMALDAEDEAKNNKDNGGSTGEKALTDLTKNEILAKLNALKEEGKVTEEFSEKNSKTDLLALLTKTIEDNSQEA